MKHLAPRKLLAVQSSEVSIQKKDSVDYSRATEKQILQKEERVFSPSSALFITVSIISYTADVISSTYVCCRLYENYPRWWFIMTVTPLVSSMVTINVVSIRWYLHDWREERYLISDVSASHWIARVTFHVIGLGPVIRYAELLNYGIKSWKTSDPNSNSYKVLVLQEDRDTSMLALIGSFIKSAPLLVLLLYILTQIPMFTVHRTPVGLKTTHAQIFAIFMSLVELSLTLCSYHRALRRCIPAKMNMTKLGTAAQFISHFCIIGCRILVLASFASVFGHWLLLMCFFHWLFMTVWLILQQTKFCSSATGEPRQWDELFFNVIIGIIYIYCFVNVKDEPTKWKYTIYYCIVCSENIALTVLWYINSDARIWYRLPLPVAALTTFAVGLLILVLYYRFLHPNKVSKVTSFIKVPCGEEMTASGS